MTVFSHAIRPCSVAALAIATCATTPGWSLRASQESQEDAGSAAVSSPYGALPYRFVGPPRNRVSAVAGVPGDWNTYYAGAASGGVWKSTDGGNRWRPLFDGQEAQSVGAIAVAPSDPNQVWVGTGETFIRKLGYLLSQRYIARGSGGILLMSSLSAYQGSAYISTYAATNAFNIVLAEG